MHLLFALMTNKWAGVQEAAHQPGPQGVPAGMGGGYKDAGELGPAFPGARPARGQRLHATNLTSLLAGGRISRSLLNPPPQ